MLNARLFSDTALRRLGGEAAVAASTSLFGKCIGFAKELFVAAAFGLSGEIDVYLVAMVLIGFPMSILLNSTQSVMIATMAADAHDASAERSAVFMRVVLLTIGALGGLLALWLALMPLLLPVFASGFSNSRLDQLWSAMLWLVPYYFLNGVNLLGYGYLQIRRKYVANGLLPALTPLSVLIIVGLGQHHATALPLLTSSIVTGAVLESASLAMLLRSLGIRLSIGARLGTAAQATVSRIARGSFHLLAGTAIMALGPLIDQSLAATLAEGSNAALAYGNKLPAAIQGVLISAIAITVLPFFSTQLAERGPQYCLTSLKRLALLVGASGLALAAPLILVSRPLVELLYVRGAFALGDAAAVAPIQSVYLLQLPVAMISMVCLKVIVAQGKHVLISALTVASVSIQLLAATALKQTHGALGIAIAGTIANALVAGAYLVFAASGLRRQTKSLGTN
jgi:putative peptidoglycan lipid II flippase